MAAYSPVLHTRKIDALCHNHYDPLSTLNRGTLQYLASKPTLLNLISSPISTHSFHFSSRATHRRGRGPPPVSVHDSSQKSSEITPQSNRFSQEGTNINFQQQLHQTSLRMIIDIIAFVWGLPSFIARFLKKEEKLLDTVEEDIIKTADVIKVGAKVVEEVAEGLEEVAEGVEKAAKVIDKDAKKVDDIMDKVKERTRTAHDELEEVVGSIQGSMGEMEKDVTKAQIKLKGAKEEVANTPTVAEDPQLVVEEKNTKNANTSHYSQFYNPLLAWRSQTLIHNFLHFWKWSLIHSHFEPLFYYMMPLLRVFFGTMLIVSFFLGITNTPLVNHAF